MQASFTTQNEESLNLDDLKGNWWIANLMYTNCRTICPRTTTNLVGVQQELKKDNLHPQIISFSIDLSYDTLEVLKKYDGMSSDELNLLIEDLKIILGKT